MVDEDMVEEIRAALEDSDRVDARRINVRASDREVVLEGSVSSPEEASAAGVIAEGYSTRVVSRLQVDANLREGTADPVDREAAVPADNEVLVGDADMLSGPDSATETDMSRAFEENVPWEPPTEPHLAPTDSEYASGASEGGPEEVDTADPAPDEVARSDYAAADLSREELELPRERVPSLDPERVATEGPATPDPLGVDSLGATTPDEPSPMPDPVPGGGAGVGATGEGTAGGGSVSGTPATETGAAGADTAGADPVRSTGGTMTDAGTHRGPQARPDEAIREDFPDADPGEGG